MNLWSDPQYQFWQVLHLAGNLPTTIVELLIVVWALRSLPERPRASKLMLGFVALLVIHQFGLPRLWELYFMMSSWLGGLGALAGTALTVFLMYGLSLALTIVIWVVTLKAVFGREEMELSDPLAFDAAAAELPGERP